MDTFLKFVLGIINILFPFIISHILKIYQNNKHNNIFQIKALDEKLYYFTQYIYIIHLSAFFNIYSRFQMLIIYPGIPKQMFQIGNKINIIVFRILVIGLVMINLINYFDISINYLDYYIHNIPKNILNGSNCCVCILCLGVTMLNGTFLGNIILEHLNSYIIFDAKKYKIFIIFLIFVLSSYLYFKILNNAKKIINGDSIIQITLPTGEIIKTKSKYISFENKYLVIKGNGKNFLYRVIDINHIVYIDYKEKVM